MLEEEFSNPNLEPCKGLLLQLDSLSLSPRQMKVFEAVLDAVVKTTAENLPKEENTDDRDKANQTKQQIQGRSKWSGPVCQETAEPPNTNPMP